MFELFGNLPSIVPVYMLVFARLSGMLASLPILSYPMVPGRLRVLFALLLSFILVPGLGGFSAEFTSIWSLFVSVARELLIGLIMGFGTKVIFEAFNMAGSFVGRQMGLAVANVMDPTSQQQLPIVSQFWLFVVVTFFLVADGHHLLIETLYRNFSIIPVSGGVLENNAGEIVLMTGSKAFTIALQFAAPTMVFMLLIDTAISFTARIMPQMNIFMVSLPLKIGVGIVVLMASLDIFQFIFDSIYTDLERYLGRIMFALTGA